MGKSGVSEALKQLQASLGVQLLIRTTRKQSPTDFGKQFYLRCRELRDLSTAAMEEVNDYLAEPIGALRVTAPHAAINGVVVPALAEVMRQYPRVEPKLIVDDKQPDLINDNIDLALTIGELPDSEFKAQRIGVVHDVLCASPDFISLHGLTGEAAAPRVLPQGLPYIAHHWEGNDITHQLLSQVSLEMETFQFHRVATASSVNAVSALICRGAGVGILPHFFLNPLLETRALVPLLPQHNPRETNLFAVHPYGSVPPLSVRAMISAMKHSLNALQ